MKAVKKLLIILPTILLFFVLVLLLTITISIRRDTTPSIFGYSTLVVVTDSMEPELKVNDVIMIRSFSKYEKEDIITFYAEISGQTVRITHRIIDIDFENEIYITQGDKAYNDPERREHPDYMELVSFEDVIGKVIFKSTLIGSIASIEFLSNKNLIFGLIFVVLFTMIAFQVLDIVKHKKDLEKNDTEESEENQKDA